MKVILTFVAALTLYPMFFSTALGVTSQEQAERLQLINGHLLDYRWDEAPQAMSKSTWKLSGEILWQPDIDNTVGTKVEPIEAPPLVPRPRAQYHHRSGWFIGGSWLPPLNVQGFEANLGNGETGWIFDAQKLQIGIRFALSAGEIKGPMTSTEHQDTFKLARFNLDTTLGYQVAKPLSLFTGIGAGAINSELHIEEDGAELHVTNHSYQYGWVGATYQWNSRIRLSFIQHQTENFLLHWTASASYRF